MAPSLILTVAHGMDLRPLCYEALWQRILFLRERLLFATSSSESLRLGLAI